MKGIRDLFQTSTFQEFRVEDVRTLEHAGFAASNFEGYVTNCAPYKALKVIA